MSEQIDEGKIFIKTCMLTISSWRAGEKISVISASVRAPVSCLLLAMALSLSVLLVSLKVRKKRTEVSSNRWVD